MLQYAGSGNNGLVTLAHPTSRLILNDWMRALEFNL